MVTLGALAVATACGQRRADLRIRNQSDVNLKNVVVFFPDARVEIGDIGAKATSEYRQIPGGVGEYAAFDFSIDGRPIEQSVADFVGWKPLAGKVFTYEVRVIPGRTEPFLDVTRVIKER